MAAPRPTRLHTANEPFGQTLVNSCAGWRRLLRSRSLQAGIKYWLVLSTLLVASVVVGAVHPFIQGLGVSSAYLTACLSMSERVESTVSKVSPGACELIAEHRDVPVLGAMPAGVLGSHLCTLVCC